MFDHNHAAISAGNGAANYEQIFFRNDIHHFQILNRNACVTHPAWQTLSLYDFRGIRACSNGTGPPVEVGSMCAGTAGKVMTFDATGKTAPLLSPKHPRGRPFKYIRANFISGLQDASVFHLEFRSTRLGATPAFLKCLRSGFVHRFSLLRQTRPNRSGRPGLWFYAEQPCKARLRGLRYPAIFRKNTGHAQFQP